MAIILYEYLTTNESSQKSSLPFHIFKLEFLFLHSFSIQADMILGVRDQFKGICIVNKIIEKFAYLEMSTFSIYVNVCRFSQPEYQSQILDSFRTQELREGLLKMKFCYQ